jgi:hypothetical protein
MSMPGPAPSVNSPFIMCGAPMRFDDFEAALDVALGVGDGLAVLARQDVGQRIVSRLASVRGTSSARARGAAGWSPPSRLRRLGVLDRGAQFGGACQRHLGAHRAVHRLHDVLLATAGAGDALAADEIEENPNRCA